MPAKFVVKKGSTGKFKVSLVAANGAVLMTSDAVDTKAAATRVVNSVRKAASAAAVDDQTAAKAALAARKAPARKAARRSSSSPAITELAQLID